MYFHFDFYPADLIAVIAGRTAEDAGQIVQQWLIGLISNSSESVADTKARESVQRMLDKCQQKSDTYRANGKHRNAPQKRRNNGGFKAQERQRDASNAAEMLTEEQKHFYGLDG